MSGCCDVPGPFLLFTKHLRELLLPVEGFVASNGGIADEGVAAFDVLVQRVEFAVGFGGAQPEGQLGNFHTLLVDVHPKEVVLQNAVLHILKHNACPRHLGFHLIDEPVLVHQELQSGVQEGTAAAGGVADGDLQQPLAILLQLLHQAFAGLFLAFLVGEILFVHNPQFRFLLGTEASHRILHNVFRDILRSVEYAVLLAFVQGGMPPCFAGQRLCDFLNLR